MLIDWEDSCINAQRRMSMVQRGFHKGQLELDTAVPKLRSKEGDPISNGSTEMQGRRPGHPSGESSLGFLLFGYPAFRRGIQIIHGAYDLERNVQYRNSDERGL